MHHQREFVLNSLPNNKFIMKSNLACVKPALLHNKSIMNAVKTLHGGETNACLCTREVT